MELKVGIKSMISILITKNQALCINSVKTHRKTTVEKIVLFKLQKSLINILHDKDKIGIIFKRCFQKISKTIPISDEQVVVGIDDDLLFQDVITTEENLSNEDAWKYINWIANQRWGEHGSKYSTFAQNYTRTPNEYQLFSCSNNLINGIKNNLEEINAHPLWMGPFSEILLESDKNDKNIFIFDQGNSYLLVGRNKVGYKNSVIKYSGGKFHLLSSIIRGEEMMKVCNNFETTIEFKCVDYLTKNKLSHWKKLKCSVLKPFNGLNVKPNQIPNGVSLRMLNIGTSIVIGNAVYDSINLFQNPYLNKLYPRELELIKKIKPIKKQVSKIRRKGVKTKKVSISKKSTFQYQPTLFLLLIVGIFSFSIYFNLNKSSSNEISIDSQTESETVSPAFTDDRNISTEIHQNVIMTKQSISQTLLNSIMYILNTFSITDNFSFSGIDLNLELIWEGDQNFDFLKSMGGILWREVEHSDNKYIVEINLQDGYLLSSDSTLSKNNFIHAISTEFESPKYRVLETIVNTTTRFDPIILQIEFIDNIQRFANWISGLAQNVIVRKVDFVNQKNGQNPKAVFHIAVYDDSFQK